MFVKENPDRKKIHPTAVERMLFWLLFCVFEYPIEIFFVKKDFKFLNIKNTHDKPWKDAENNLPKTKLLHFILFSFLTSFLLQNIFIYKAYKTGRTEAAIKKSLKIAA